MAQLTGIDADFFFGEQEQFPDWRELADQDEAEEPEDEIDEEHLVSIHSLLGFDPDELDDDRNQTQPALVSPSPFRDRKYLIGYRVKGEGQPCEQGQNPGRDRCVAVKEDSPKAEVKKGKKPKPTRESTVETKRVSEVQQHYGDWYEQLPKAAKKLMDRYTMDSTTLNSYQRFPEREWYRPDDPSFTKNLDKRITSLKRIINSSPPLKEPVTVYRGIQAFRNSPQMVEMVESLQPGAVLEDKGFMSTTPSESGTDLFRMGEDSVTIHIKLPAGIKVAYLKNTYDEILLPPGTRLRIVSRTGNTVIAEVLSEN